jgi:hypothetical protein
VRDYKHPTTPLPQQLSTLTRHPTNVREYHMAVSFTLAFPFIVSVTFPVRLQLLVFGDTFLRP